MLKTGIFATSSKKHEKRVPLHPELFSFIAPEICQYLVFESGYAAEYGYSDDYFRQHFGGVLAREDLFDGTDLWVLPKPTSSDFKYFKPGKTLWGWPHCVQGHAITQALLDNKMTTVAWEAMYGGRDHIHVFQKNNEMAGYAAVHHMMMLTGKNGYFGGTLKAAVLGFGSSGRGAVHALQTLGINHVDVFTQRPSHLVAAPAVGVNFGNIAVRQAETYLCINGKEAGAAAVLGQYDIIVNCVLQDPTNPVMFVQQGELNKLVRVRDIIDVSCDKEMGFYFAKPTDFDQPTFKVDSGYINYYSVDHTPALYWDAASYEISKALLPYLTPMVKGQWHSDATLSAAIEIENGSIINNKIIQFQHREANPPYRIAE
jgi:alanine dehydrogenase